MVQCPQIVWPREFSESGPEDDPTIFLRGNARLADRPFSVVAIRVAPNRRFMPDYKEDVDEAAYSELRLDFLLEELGALLDADTLPVIELGGGQYVVAVLPKPLG
jgi:hypothetical protein